jgi:hypothetical protein
MTEQPHAANGLFVVLVGDYLCRPRSSLIRPTRSIRAKRELTVRRSG